MEEMLNEMPDTIVFTGEDGEEVEFYVLDQTKVNGTDYVLVTDSWDEEADAFILKDVSEAGDEEGVYEFVEDDVEFDAVAKIFEEMFEGEDIDLE